MKLNVMTTGKRLILGKLCMFITLHRRPAPFSTTSWYCGGFSAFYLPQKPTWNNWRLAAAIPVRATSCTHCDGPHVSGYLPTWIGSRSVDSWKHYINALLIWWVPKQINHFSFFVFFLIKKILHLTLFNGNFYDNLVILHMIILFFKIN